MLISEETPHQMRQGLLRGHQFQFVEKADAVVCFINGRVAEELSHNINLNTDDVTVEGVIVRALEQEINQGPEQSGATVQISGQDLRVAVVHFHQNEPEVLAETETETNVERKTATNTAIKNIYILEEGARAEVTEAHFMVGNFAGAIKNSAGVVSTPDGVITQIKNKSEVRLAGGATLCFGQFLAMREAAVDFSNDTFVDVAREASIKFLTLAGGGRKVCSQYELHLRDEGAHLAFLNLVVGAGESLTESNSLIVHEKGGTRSAQVAKSIMSGSSQFVFSGRVVINQNAQRSDASQYNHNLLLSEKAEVKTRPQLEVLADDVKATHGATVGSLQESELFYLQSRGLSHEQAISMLVEGFAADLFEKMPSNFVVSAAHEIMTKTHELLSLEGRES